MKILMTADPIGGVWSYALELCAALNVFDVDVVLATLGGPLTRDQRASADALPNVSLHESLFRLEWMPDPWDDLEHAGEWLLGLEAEDHPDVIHLNHLVHADLPWRAPVLSVGHSCVLSWWSAVRGGPIPADWNTYRDRVTHSLRAAQCVAAPSRAMLIELQRYYGPLRNCVVIPNGRHPSRFTSAPKEPFVLCAGRLWDEAKNVASLADVAARIQWPVQVAGVADAPGGGTASFAGVRRLGPLNSSALRQCYARAAIYALPARYEPFGLTPLEAALSGCALVLGDIPSLREVWGDAALFVDPNDRDALARTLEELIADTDLRRELSAGAVARAREFSPERFVGGYRTVYRKLIEDSRHATLRLAGTPAGSGLAVRG